MEFYLSARMYNMYGGHSTLSLIPDFLIGDAEGFGPAVTELTVAFHFPHSGPPLSTLEEMYAAFHANRLSLPKVVFRRKKGQVEIDIASELIDGKDWDHARGLSLPLFKGAVAETISALGLLRKRLTAKNDFNLEAFLAQCAKAQSRLPSTLEQLAAFAEASKKKQIARYEAKSPWEKLGIDWSDFHPDARKILDDPFYWESSNDFAPNGNDTGADLLADYRKWLQRNPSGEPGMFYQQLIRRWGFPAEPSSDLDGRVMNEAAVALAFAEFKLRADCRLEVAALARAAIQRQRQQSINAIAWPHRDERLKSLDMLEAKLPASGYR